MSNRQKPSVITGRMIGVLRLTTLIKALELEIQGLTDKVNAYRSLKRELGIKGSREGVLRCAKEVLADVKNW